MLQYSGYRNHRRHPGPSFFLTHFSQVQFCFITTHGRRPPMHSLSCSLALPFHHQLNCYSLRVLSSMNTPTLYVILLSFLIATQIELLTSSALIPITSSSVTMITHQLPIVYSFYIRPTVDSQLKEGGQVCN